MDAAQQRMQRFYRDMRQRQNMRSPVNRLPRELLEVICEYTVPWFWYTRKRHRQPRLRPSLPPLARHRVQPP